jgi:hypothetical protein
LGWLATTEVPSLGTRSACAPLRSSRRHKNNWRPRRDVPMAEMLEPVTDAEIGELAYWVLGRASP